MGRSRCWPRVAGCLVLLLAAVTAAVPAGAQALSETVNDIFKNALDLKTVGPPPHGEHFKLSNVAANDAIRQAFNTLISANLSSFPLSSTVSGLTFDFSSGVPVATTTSLGPIFAERAQTLGRRRVNLGVNASFLSFNEFRGVPTDQLRFSFSHQDVPPGSNTGLGDNDNEFDVLNMIVDMDIDAKVVAFYGTFGVTDRIDVGIAVPVISASLKGKATATFDSFSKARRGTANHVFVSANGDTSLTLVQNFDNSATGIGDVALRAKYNFYRGQSIDAGVFADIRVPTGDEEDYLGAGDPNVRAQLILSWTAGNFNPHINTGFEYRGSDLDPNEFELVLGFDQKLAERLTFATEFSGEYEVGDSDAIGFPGPITISGVGSAAPDPLPQPLTKIVVPTNIPDRADNLNNTSLGLKWSPRDNLLFLANAIVGLNNGGLRANIVPTIGFEYNF